MSAGDTLVDIAGTIKVPFHNSGFRNAGHYLQITQQV